MRRITITLCVVAALTLSAWAAQGPLSTAPAAGITDVLKVDYFANANTSGAPDGTLRVTNPGTAAGNICAYIFVFDPYQELSECCGCLNTPDGLATLSINSDLTSNPLTGVTLSTGAIKILSVSPIGNACPLPGQTTGSDVIEPAIRAWTTHIQNTTFAETETAAQDATLSAGEVVRLRNECAAIVLDGSGKGICSCGSGD
ncbi:MAG TPA: hypothetical protein VMX38_10950 [Verrucomicrobiae bacterium]|jgi:hypothetical protein|nr:hypothetical protein [Verrucomicrobiae bacterium]